MSALSEHYVNGSSLTAPLDPEGGDLLVVGMYWDEGGGAATVDISDSLGNAWRNTSEQSEACEDEGSQTKVQIWYATNVTGGADTLTTTLTGGTDTSLGLFVLEYAGLAASGAYDSPGRESRVHDDDRDGHREPDHHRLRRSRGRLVLR